MSIHPDHPIRPDHPEPHPTRPGQESVWSYPRPPRIETTSKLIRVEFAGHTLAETRNAIRFLETSHPPSYYIPRADVDMTCLQPVAGQTYCEWKGDADYYDVVIADRRANRSAWTYEHPVTRYALLKQHIAFFAVTMDACYVDGERVTPQPGNFYGGWITSDVAGPFKGSPGTLHW